MLEIKEFHDADTQEGSIMSTYLRGGIATVIIFLVIHIVLVICSLLAGRELVKIDVTSSPTMVNVNVSLQKR